jgi:hypothetical protein
VTTVRRLHLLDVVGALGGDPSVAPEPLAPLLTGGPYAEMAAVGSVGDAVVALEFNGFQGSRPEVLRPASHEAVAVSVFWNAKGMSKFAYAVAGDVVTQFEFPSSGRAPIPTGS